MKIERTVLRWCQTLAVLAACLAVSAGGAVAEELLYPHAEREFGPWGYIDKTGKVVIPVQFEAAEPFSEGLAVVMVHNRESTFFRKRGYIDRTGALVIPDQFMQAQPFRSGRAAVMFAPSRPNPDARWGLIDRDGKLILPATYASIGMFNDGRAIVSVKDGPNKHKAGAIDLDGQVVVPLANDWMLPYSDGLAAARRDGKFGFLDKSGAVVVPFEFTRAWPFSQGFARVSKGPKGFGEVGVIDMTGAVIIPFDYQMIHEFSEGYAVAAKKGGGYELIDTSGKVVALPQVRMIGQHSRYPMPYQQSGRSHALSDGLLPVRASWEQGYGYVDKDGAFVLQPRFRQAYGFHDGLAAVTVDAESGFGVKGARGSFSGLIDKRGQFVAEPVFDWIRQRAGGLSQVKFGEKLGYIDARGRPLTFSAKELDDYIAARRERLKEDPMPQPGQKAKPLPRPAAGRALFAKAGDTEYYLRLPDSLCPLDDSQPADQQFIQDRWAEADKADEARKAMKPMSADAEQAMRKSTEDLKRKSRFVLGCDQLEKLRAGADRKLFRSYVRATPMQKDDRYDPSLGAGSFWANAFLCGMLPGADAFRWSDGMERDSTATVGDAFKRLGAGKGIALVAKAPALPACYIALLRPDRASDGGAPVTAKLMAFASLTFGDWMVQVERTSEGVSSPETFFRAYEQDRETIEAIAKANMKR